ncbi:hypothetical protein LIA77_05239 [Sarocladium implicatum]|nr:hypothetical protein LIA77_05239 [Sarocladium implicatum]
MRSRDRARCKRHTIVHHRDFTAACYVSPSPRATSCNQKVEKSRFSLVSAASTVLPTGLVVPTSRYTYHEITSPPFQHRRTLEQSSGRRQRPFAQTGNTAIIAGASSTVLGSLRLAIRELHLHALLCRPCAEPSSACQRPADDVVMAVAEIRCRSLPMTSSPVRGTLHHRLESLLPPEGLDNYFAPAIGRLLESPQALLSLPREMDPMSWINIRAMGCPAEPCGVPRPTTEKWFMGVPQVW